MFDIIRDSKLIAQGIGPDEAMEIIGVDWDTLMDMLESGKCVGGYVLEPGRELVAVLIEEELAAARQSVQRTGSRVIEEVAMVMGIATSTVYRHLDRARKHMCRLGIEGEFIAMYRHLGDVRGRKVLA